MQDVGHRQVGGLGGGEQERGEVARAGWAPEGVVGGAAVLWSPTPSSAAAVRRAPVHVVDALSGDHTACPSEVAWVGSNTRASPSFGARGERLDEDVGLDRRREHGSVPLAHRGHDQPGGLARLGRSDDHHRRALLGGDQGAAVVAERDPPRARGAGRAARRDRTLVAQFADRLRGAASRSRLASAPGEHGTRAATVDQRDQQDGVQLAGAGEVATVGGRPRERGVGQVRDEPREQRARG